MRAAVTDCAEVFGRLTEAELSTLHTLLSTLAT
jgi:hypothetical protein